MGSAPIAAHHTGDTITEVEFFEGYAHLLPAEPESAGERATKTQDSLKIIASTDFDDHAGRHATINSSEAT
ncbi:hypothetical protein ABZ749_30155 [Micromonospora sp. NPDC047753]|uniref:hypothetical protein n=1 Tax=Micromonospora sp. NPDC047753 TaxID=3154817 RepID=UPI0033F6DC0D